MGKRLSIDYVKSVVVALGHEPLFDEFLGAKHKLKCKCQKHGVFYADWTVLKRCYQRKRGNGCVKCAIERDIIRKSFTLEKAQDLVRQLGLIPLFTEYIDNDTPLLVKCEIHGEFMVRLGDIQKKLKKQKNGNCCKGCRDDVHRKIPKEQQDIRKTAPYRKWRIAVLEKFNYTCGKCGDNKENGAIMHAHHIISFSDSIENRFNVDNGFTFCEKCHKKFHKLYGNTNNKIQLVEFLNNEEN